MGLLVARPCASTLRRCRRGEQRRRASPRTTTTTWIERVGERSKQGEVSKEREGRKEGDERVNLRKRVGGFFFPLSPSLDHHKKEHRLLLPLSALLSLALELGAARLARGRKETTDPSPPARHMPPRGERQAPSAAARAAALAAAAAASSSASATGGNASAFGAAPSLSAGFGTGLGFGGYVRACTVILKAVEEL